MAVEVNMFSHSHPTAHHDVRETEQERDSLKLLIKMHSVLTLIDLDFFAYSYIVNAWGLGSCVRGVYFTLQTFVSEYFDPCYSECNHAVKCRLCISSK